MPWVIIWHVPKHPPHDGDTPPNHPGVGAEGNAGKNGGEDNAGTKVGDGNAGAKGGNPPKSPEAPQSPGKKKKGSGHGTASQSLDGSGGISSEHQPGAHKPLRPSRTPSGGPPATAGHGQGKPEGPNKKSSPTTGSHIGVPPSSVRTGPSGPHDSPYYNPRRTFKTRRNTSTPPLIH